MTPWPDGRAAWIVDDAAVPLKGKVAAVTGAGSGIGRVMVANAAVGLYADLEEMAEDDLYRVIDVDLKGALLCAQAAIPALRARAGGSIVFVSSVQAYTTLRGCVVYGAAKAGLVAAAARWRSRSASTGSGSMRSRPARSTRRCSRGTSTA
jgi:NAD(P)-dependent dehydrogenase (short-subunit alcohol dehydrogenase family)